MSRFVVGHEILFAPEILERCDACGDELLPREISSARGFDDAPHGVYLTTRGDEIRLEKAPLCGSCSTAIGVTALMQWDIEEEEG